MLNSCSEKLNNLVFPSVCEELMSLVYFMDCLLVIFNFAPFPSLKPNANKFKTVSK